MSTFNVDLQALWAGLTDWGAATCPKCCSICLFSRQCGPDCISQYC